MITRDLPQEQPSATRAGCHDHAGRPGSWRRFALHYAEMVLAMLVGMAVFGFAVRALLGLAGVEFSMETRPVLVTLEMALDMTVAMCLWMRVRGHRWAPTLEMAGAMFAPAPPVMALLWLGAVDTGAAMAIEHAAMFTLMLAAMLRRRVEYGGPSVPARSS